MPMVGGKKYPYTAKGMEAANKASKAKAKGMAMGSKDKSSAAQRDRQRTLNMAINEARPGGSLKNMPNKKNMPYRPGTDKPKMKKMPNLNRYKPGADKQQMLKAKLDSLTKKKK